MRLAAKSNPMRSQTFTIVGLGLLGASLGGALKKIFPRSKIIGVSRSRAKIRLAKQKGFITAGTTSLPEAVRSADFVFICTPVDTIPKLISEIDRSAKTGAIVTDVGSTKETLIRWVEKKRFKNICFVGAHPMAGSHLTGLRHANSKLYRSSFVFVTVHRGMNALALAKLTKIWRKLSRKVIQIDASIHDSVAAEISHLPHLVSALLINAATDRALRFAGTGFCDTTRIAQGDPRLWVPIFTENRKNLLRLLAQFRKSILKVENHLRSRDRFSLSQLLKKSAGRRQKIA